MHYLCDPGQVIRHLALSFPTYTVRRIAEPSVRSGMESECRVFHPVSGEGTGPARQVTSLPQVSQSTAFSRVLCVQGCNCTLGRDIPNTWCYLRHASLLTPTYFRTTLGHPAFVLPVPVISLCVFDGCEQDKRWDLSGLRCSVSGGALTILGMQTFTANSSAFLLPAPPHLQNTPGTAQLVGRISNMTGPTYSHQEALRAITFLRKGKISLLNHAQV